MKKLFFLFLIFPAILVAQESVKVDLSNPNATVYTHIYFLQKDSYEPKKSAQTIIGLPEKDAIEAAIRIKRILDGKGLMVDFSKIPTKANYQDTISYEVKSKYVLFPERMPLISVEKVKDSWYYSKETIDNIDMLYEDIFPWYIDSVQEIIPGSGHKKIFDIELWQYITFLLLIIAAVIVFWIAKKISFFILSLALKMYMNKGNDEITTALKKLAHPIALLVALSLIDKIFPSLQFGLSINQWAFMALNIAATIFWIYVFLKIVQVIMSIYHQFTERTESKLDDQLVPIIRNFLNGLIILFGIFKMLTYLGTDYTTILAGVSIGGLALAFASQDTVKNLIGTVMIFVDKPFHIGDWVSAGEVVGTVEEVGFRSTRVRAADTTIYQIPNSKLSEIVINNAGLRLYRRYKTELGIRYDTPPELIEAFVEGVREIIIAHPDTKSDAYNVEFIGFGDSALQILVNLYLKNLEWGKEQSSKHQIHIAIVKLAKQLGVEFAFPSTTVMIEQFPEKKSFDVNYNIDEKRMKEVIAKSVEDFKKVAKRSESE